MTSTPKDFVPKGRDGTRWRGNYLFHHEHLTHEENTIIRMARNNYTNKEIIEKLELEDITRITRLMTRLRDWGFVFPYQRHARYPDLPTAEELYRRVHHGREKPSEIGKEFGVSGTTICDKITNWQRWLSRKKHYGCE